MPNEKMILASNPHWFYFWKQVAAGAGVIGLLLLLATRSMPTGSTRSSVGRDRRGDRADPQRRLSSSCSGRRHGSRSPISEWRTRAASSAVAASRSRLNRINNVNFNQSAIARVLNNGVVTIESAGETGDSVFENIPDPEKVRTLIFAQVEADEQADSDRDAAALAKAMRDQIPPTVERLRRRPRRPGSLGRARGHEGTRPGQRRRVRHQASADPRRTLIDIRGQTRGVTSWLPSGRRTRRSRRCRRR